MLGEISSVLASISTTIEIARAIRDSGSEIDKAELKLRLAEVLSGLADAKIDAISVSERIATLEHQIKELEDALERKNDVARHHDAMYVVNESGVACGEPYCLACWELKHQLRPLKRVMKSSGPLRICVQCGNDYDAMRAGIISSKGA